MKLREIASPPFHVPRFRSVAEFLKSPRGRFSRRAKRDEPRSRPPPGGVMKGSSSFVAIPVPRGSSQFSSAKSPESKRMAKPPQFSWNRAALGGLGLVAVVLFGIFIFSGKSSQGLRSMPEKFRIAIIADLDKLSKKTGADGKAVWHSKYMTVRVGRDCRGLPRCALDRPLLCRELSPGLVSRTLSSGTRPRMSSRGTTRLVVAVSSRSSSGSTAASTRLTTGPGSCLRFRTPRTARLRATTRRS